MEHFEGIQKLVEESGKTKFYLFKSLCELAMNSWVTEGKNLFIVEIDAEENRNLEEDIQRNFLIRVIKWTRPDKKMTSHRSGEPIFENKGIQVVDFL